MNENEQNLSPDFSDVPALGDTQGLENYLNNATLAAQGVQVEQPAQQTATEQPQTVAETTAPQGTSFRQMSSTTQYTPEELDEIAKKVIQIQNQQAQISRAQQTQQAANSSSYTPNEQRFVAEALRRGYNLEQINQTIINERRQNGVSNQINQRITNIEQFLQSQQYQQAQNAFISKASAFADKWGLSDTDVETFAKEALKYGINIADDRVDLEMVFRAVYPQQYAIRSQRMTPTNSSQIYGGTSIPEGNRANTSRLEDQYVDAFLKGAMPNQYAASKK